MTAISEEEAAHLLALQTMVVAHELDRKRRRRLYVRPIFARRKNQGYFNLVRELELFDSENFGHYVTYAFRPN